MTFSKILLKKITDPLFCLGIICMIFWVADSYMKLFVLNAPSRMLWYSSAGLGVTTIALFTRSHLLMTAMFCAMIVNESLWSISFLSHLIFNKDPIGMTKYMFNSNMPWSQFIISLYHLILVPATVIGLIVLKKIHKFGWIAAFIFVTTVDLLVYYFPDAVENVNCVQGPTLFSCKLFFNPFYEIYSTYLNSFDRAWGILMVTTSLTLLIYLPINCMLLFFVKIYNPDPLFKFIRVLKRINTNLE